MSLAQHHTHPGPVRARAYGEVLAALGRAPEALAPVASWGARAVDAVIALEAAFGIDLEVDEVMHLRMAGLLDLVEARAAGETLRVEVYDPERGVFLFPARDFPAPGVGANPVGLTPATGRRRRARRARRLTPRGRLLVAYALLWAGAIGCAVLGLAGVLP